MTYDKRLAEFKEYIRKIEYQKWTLNSLIYWDKVTNMPKGSHEYRAKVMAHMGEEMYNMMQNIKFLNDIKYFLNNPKNDDITNAMIYRLINSSSEISLIPVKEYQEYLELIAESEVIWEQARKENDFELFRPYLEKIFNCFRNFADYWGYEKNPYDALMQYYVSGVTTEIIDGLIDEVKPFLIESLTKIRELEESRKDRESELCFATPEKQKSLWEEVLRKIGFDFDYGRVDIGEHPTILANSPYDVRIVNNYRDEDAYFGFFNILHSAGKGMYHQSIDKELLGTMLAEPPTFVIEEAIGRFYENIIGRSKGFWNDNIEMFHEATSSDKKIDSREGYEHVNRINCSQVRIEADEISYLLHIIIRYEIEKDIIDGKLKVKDLPKEWNEKCKAYLGSEPKNDSEGVLQDIHWAAGYVGYFPTYILSNLISTQLANAMETEIGDLSELAEKGEYAKIKDWLKENIFKYGARCHTRELVENASGEKLSPKYYIRYLRNKYSDVYDIIL